MITIYKVVFLIIMLISPVTALQSLGSYGSYECERISKDVMVEYGAKMVFIIPLQENGAYVTGDYAGHWINYKRINGKDYFIDWGKQLIFESKKEVAEWYYPSAEVFIIGIDTIPFSMIYHT